MRILVGKTFGLGNCVMSLPMLKALRSILGPEDVLDVLIGSTSDDGGAFDVFKYLCKGDKDSIINHVWIDKVHSHVDDYDIAIMAIPFDGRWTNGIHYKAKTVMDGRTRPDPSTTGLVSWERHEVEYQMDNARELGFKGATPDTSFYPEKGNTHPRDIYLGIGYKKDGNNFWSKKHWGNPNFADFTRTILREYDNALIKCTGDILDFRTNILNLRMDIARDEDGLKLINRFISDVTNLDEAFRILNTCGLYVGNDTGMMHVAASMGIPCVTIFNLGQHSVVKNRPWGHTHVNVDSEVIEDTLQFVTNKVMGFIDDKR